MADKSKNVQYTNSGRVSAQNDATVGQFNFVKTGFHRHTGADAPRINYNDLINTPTTSSILSGNINSDGSVVYLPSGWTCTKGGTGAYQISHTIGSTNYVPVACSKISSVVVRIVNVYNITSGSFYVEVFDTSGTSQDDGFTFVVALTS